MKKAVKISIWIVLFLYTLFALWLLFIRDRGNSGLGIIEHFKTHNNLIPFSTVIHDIGEIIKGNRINLYIRNFFGNTMLIFPFGLFLPILTGRYKSAKRIFILFVLVIITVELAQLVLRVGSVDADDLIINVIGGMIGYGIYKLFFNKTLDKSE